jgi:signal transduction histidine kinase/DNA-binding response OmpR family regulator
VPFSIPADEVVGAPSNAGSPPADEARRPDAPVILVVDDAEGNRFAVARWLEHSGFRVIEAASGADALERAAEVVDLVVLDVVLPDIHGFEVARRLRANPRTAHVPVLHLSAARVAAADRAQGLETGADAYVTHPFVPEELLAMVRALLRTARETRALREQRATLAASLREAERAIAWMTRLQTATAALVRATSAAEIAEIVLAEAMAAVEADAGAVLVVDDGRDALVPLGSRVAASSAWPPAVTPLGALSPAAEAVRAARPVWLESQAVLPLHVDDAPVGALCIAFTAPRALDAAERTLLAAFADQCGQALERARLREIERAAEAERERLYALEQRARVAVEEAYHEAELANQAKTEFLAVMSHELRTPLNAIGGYAELMEMGIRGPVTDEQRADLARMRAAQRYLLSLVTNVLSFVRVESGHVEYQLAEVPVHEALAAAEGLVGPQLRTHGVVYGSLPCDASLRVRADRDKLQQILVNLLANALKFTEPGGRVTLACEARANAVAILVSDTGVGIAPERLAAVFEPLVQVKPPDARPHEGVGLGLAISCDLARGIGGDVTVESAPGVGSTFTVTLPRA